MAKTLRDVLAELWYGPDPGPDSYGAQMAANYDPRNPLARYMTTLRGRPGMNLLMSAADVDQALRSSDLQSRGLDLQENQFNAQTGVLTPELSEGLAGTPFAGLFTPGSRYYLDTMGQYTDRARGYRAGQTISDLAKGWFPEGSIESQIFTNPDLGISPDTIVNAAIGRRDKNETKATAAEGYKYLLSLLPEADRAELEGMIPYLDNPLMGSIFTSRVQTAINALPAAKGMEEAAAFINGLPDTPFKQYLGMAIRVAGNPALSGLFDDFVKQAFAMLPPPQTSEEAAKIREIEARIGLIGAQTRHENALTGNVGKDGGSGGSGGPGSPSTVKVDDAGLRSEYTTYIKNLPKDDDGRAYISSKEVQVGVDKRKKPIYETQYVYAPSFEEWLRKRGGTAGALDYNRSVLGRNIPAGASQFLKDHPYQKNKAYTENDWLAADRLVQNAAAGTGQLGSITTAIIKAVKLGMQPSVIEALMARYNMSHPPRSLADWKKLAGVK
jgi:hypothetical protein